MRWIAALTVAAGIVLSGGADAKHAWAATFVGSVQGSDAYIAVTKDGRKIGGYVCDNGTVSRWIEYAWLKRGRAPLIAGTTGEQINIIAVLIGLLLPAVQ